VLEQSPALTGDVHDRRAPGLNHLAFTVGGRPEVDRLTTEAQTKGWSLLFPDRHPHAGGPDSYAAYLEDNWGYEIELQADPP
jgi:catechol-2,3-dioxygenase